jgi:clan AA aspartic protease
MIEGIVNEYREATVDLTLRGPTGHAERLEFVIDTGFDGGLILHSSVAAALGLPYLGGERAMLADGSETLFDTSEALLDWNGSQRLVVVDIADTVSHIGMQLLEGHELYIHAVPNGRVQITSISDFLSGDSLE